MKLESLVKVISNTRPKKRKVTNVVYCIHATLPVPLWYDANARNEKNMIIMMLIF